MEFINDDALTLGAALAFYTAVSMAPLVLILLAITSLLGPDVQTRTVQEIQSTMGSSAGHVIGEIVRQGRQQQYAGTVSAILGIAIVLLSATGVFAQMQYSLNRIWNIQPKAGSTLWLWLRNRLISFGMILAIGFILLVSLSISTAINMIFAGTAGSVWKAVNTSASLVVYTAAFAVIYKVLPDAEITWKDVWVGALLTAILFDLGRLLLALYVGRSAITSPYGTAGSLVAVLLWIYYAALIFFFGAELTQTWAVFHGRQLQPEAHAEKTPQAEEERQRQRQKAGH